MRMHPDTIFPGQESVPHAAGFAGVAILAQKVANVDRDRFQWQTNLDSVLSSRSQYPQPKHHEK